MTFADAISAMRYFERNGFEIEITNPGQFTLVNKEVGCRQSFSSKEDAVNWIRGFAEAKLVYSK